MNFFDVNKKVADAVDVWRLVPRGLVAIYMYLFYFVTAWFMSLVDPTMAQAGFVSTIVGAGAAIFGLYVNSGTGKKS